MQVVRSSLGYLLYQAEAGTQCPQTMTFACVPALSFLTDEQKSYGYPISMPRVMTSFQ